MNTGNSMRLCTPTYRPDGLAILACNALLESALKIRAKLYSGISDFRGVNDCEKSLEDFIRKQPSARRQTHDVP